MTFTLNLCLPINCNFCPKAADGRVLDSCLRLPVYKIFTIGLFQSDTSVFYFEADRRIHPVKCKLNLRQLFGNFFQFFLRVLDIVVRVDIIHNR